jgi:hypothetical protein
MEHAKQGFRRIRREHVEQSCRELLRRGAPKGGGSYFICFDEHELPAKLILKEAYRLANGVEISSTAFSGGSYTARILEGLTFQVVVRSRQERPPTP